MKAPLRLAASEWAGHVPFAMFLVDILSPVTIVELGTFSGVSYCAFCQAVAELGLDCRCYAVDNWEGDPQSGFFGPEVLEELKQHHDPLYGGFSTLIQSTFDEAVSHFADSTIDLLHIDGYHAYEVVKHDFENWLPKMSSRGIILLHDINVREGDFGVWKLWDELKVRYPHFEFIHEHGLGLAAVGEAYNESLRQLLALRESDRVPVRQFFSQLGQRLEVRLERDHAVKSLSWQVDDKQKIIETLTPQLAQKDEAIAWLSAQVKEEGQKSASELAEKDQIIAARDEAIAHLSQRLSEEESIITARDKAIACLQEELAPLRKAEESARALAAQIVEKEKIVVARDEAIAHLSQHVAEQGSIITARDKAIACLQEELVALRKEVLAEKEDLAQTLSKLAELGYRRAVMIGERERASKALLAQVAELTTKLTEKEEEARYGLAQLEQRETIVRAREETIASLKSELAESKKENHRLAGSNNLLKFQREETIASLKSELAESQKKNHRLAGSNNLLKFQLTKKDQAIHMLSGSLAANDARLNWMTNTLGWRLLSLYGPIKYRYLLPVYRMLGLMPKTTNGQLAPPAIQLEESMRLLTVELEEVKLAIESLSSEVSQQLAPPAIQLEESMQLLTVELEEVKLAIESLSS
ncbi:MAG: class I SAM-dependent methyltransferase, partial [Acidobacteriota bacterium]